MPTITTDAPATVETVPNGSKAEMMAEADRRISLLDASVAKPDGTVKTDTAESASAATTEGKAATAESAPKVAPKPPTNAPAPTPTPDLSFVPAAHRQFFENAPPEVKQYMRDWYGDYTQKTQGIAAEKEQLKARKGAADFGDAVMADEQALEALRALAKSREAGGAAPAAEPAGKPFDWTTATNEQIEARIAAIRKEAADTALQTLDGRHKSETAEQAFKRETAVAARAAFIDTGSYESAQVDGLFDSLGGFKGMKALADAKGEEFSKDFVVATLRSLLPPAKAPEAKQDSPRESNGVLRDASNGASALTRGSGTTAPLNLPQFMRDGREPSDVSDRLAEAFAIANARRATRGQVPLAHS